MWPMAKKKNRKNRLPKLKGPTSSYTDAEGNVLVLRQTLSGGTIRQMRSEFVSDAFTVSGTPVEAVRISLGGVLSRAEVRTALDYLSHILEHETERGTGFA